MKHSNIHSILKFAGYLSLFLAIAVWLELGTALAVGPQRSEALITANCNSDTPTAKVFLNVVSGPYGYIPSPKLDQDQSVLDTDFRYLEESANYNYPSLIFYISAVPQACIENDGTVHSKSDTDQFPEWLDATLTIERTCTPPSKTCTVDILQILPQQSIGGYTDQAPTQIANAIASIATSLAPAFPGTNSELTGSASALNVVFKGLFPPKSTAYQYAWIGKPTCNDNGQDAKCPASSGDNGNSKDNDNGQEFGWYFRPSAEKGIGEQTILGTQQGILLLRTSKDVKSITIVPTILAKWKLKVNKDNFSRMQSQSDDPKDASNISIDIKNNTSGFYDSLKDLSAFPALIPVDIAKKILHLNGSQSIDSIEGLEKPLVDSNCERDTCYVRKASLEAFIKGSDHSETSGSSKSNQHKNVKPVQKK